MAIVIYFSIGKRFKRIVCQQIQKPAKKLEESLFYRKTSDSNSFNVNLSRKEEEFLLLIYSRKFETNRMSLSLNQIEIGLGNDINDRKRSISVDGESSLSKINEWIFNPDLPKNLLVSINFSHPSWKLTSSLMQEYEVSFWTNLYLIRWSWYSYNNKAIIMLHIFLL